MRLSVLALLLCPLLAGAQDRVCVRLIVEERQQEHPDRAGFAGGSATAIAPDLLLTCAHVVDHALMVVVADGDRRLVADGWEIHAGWAARTPGAKEDPLCDLAVVRAPGAKFTPARLADSDPKPGVELWQWGHPALAIKPVRKAGTVLPFDGFLWSSLPSRSGDSGAGVFDTHGRLCGVTRGGCEDPGGPVPVPNTASVRLATVKRFLAGVRPGLVKADDPPPAR